jgi:hypothetical protein
MLRGKEGCLCDDVRRNGSCNDKEYSDGAFDSYSMLVSRKIEERR